MHGLPDIEVAKRLYGGPNGINVLAVRTFNGEIPGFKIPADLLLEIIERDMSYLERYWETQPIPVNEDTRPLPNFHPATIELGGLAPALFGDHHVSTSNDRTDRNVESEPSSNFHVDEGMKSSLGLHIQVDIEGDEDRKVYLAKCNVPFGRRSRVDERLDEVVEYMEKEDLSEFHFAGLGSASLPDSLTDEEIAISLAKLMKCWNRGVPPTADELVAGTTEPGAGIVISQFHDEPTAHLFRGYGRWIRVNERHDTKPPLSKLPVLQRSAAR